MGYAKLKGLSLSIFNKMFYNIYGDINENKSYRTYYL